MGYMSVLLRRAQCHVEIDQKDEAKADFGRYVMLVEGARKFPYPPENEGSPCYFDMPSQVSNAQLTAVKSEMESLGMKLLKKKKSGIFSRSRGNAEKNVSSTEEKKSTAKNAKTSKDKKKSPRKSGCCKTSAVSQVVEPSQAPSSEGSTQKQKRRVSFGSSKLAKQLAKPRPAFDDPLDDSSVIIDTKVNYYGILGLAQLASGSDIKQAYHKLAREYHPDKNTSGEASAQFQKIKLAYAILSDTKRKAQYDEINKAGI